MSTRYYLVTKCGAPDAILLLSGAHGILSGYSLVSTRYYLANICEPRYYCYYLVWTRDSLATICEPQILSLYLVSTRYYLATSWLAPDTILSLYGDFYQILSCYYLVSSRYYAVHTRYFKMLFYFFWGSIKPDVC